MIITPIGELKVGSKDIAESNKKRIDKIVSVGKTNIGFTFAKLEEILNNGAPTVLKDVLENEIYFEIISDNFIDEIAEVYNCLDNELICDYLNSLKESYTIRGERGIRYSWTSIVRKYKGLAKC